MASENASVNTDFITAEVDPNQFRPTRTRALSRGLTVIGLVLAICVVVSVIVIHQRESALEAELQRRLDILSADRAEIIETWLEGLVRLADRVVDSELFRLFATEMDIMQRELSDLAPGADPSPDDLAFEATLSDQLPYMEQILSDFAQNAEFVAGYVVNREGIAYVASDGALSMSAEQQAIARTIFETGQLTFGPARRAPSGVVIDFYRPILTAQFELAGGQYPVDPAELSRILAEETVGVLMLTTAINEELLEILAPPPLSERGERVVLVQRSGDELFQVDPNVSPPVRPVEQLAELDEDEGLNFGQRTAVGDNTTVYSAGKPVLGTAWSIVYEFPKSTLNTLMGGYITAVVTVAVLIILAVIAAFGAFWWRLSNEHSSALADQFKRLAARIDSQRRFLNSINNSMTEYLSVKSREGKYRYVNPAFAKAVNRDAEEIIGMDDAALFGQGTAERLVRSDRRVLEQSGPIAFTNEVYLQSRLHHLQVSKSPYQDDSGTTTGVVSVISDITELVEEQQKREKAMHQMVTSLVRAVELRDPYLAGHSRRVAGFARAVAEELEATPEEIATVEIAANLSQIGKLAVPVEILTKPGRLSDEEIEQLQSHVTHAESILRDIDFELPVLETVTQMHERLDGGGYPKGLSGDQVGLPGRILGACDVFCARLEPRGYRGGLAPDVALEILEQNEGRYDPRVIAALRKVANSVTGEKLIADLNAAD